MYDQVIHYLAKDIRLWKTVTNALCPRRDICLYPFWHNSLPDSFVLGFISICLQVYPVIFGCVWRSLLHVFLGRLLFLLPCGF